MHKLFILIVLLASLELFTDSSSVFAKDTVKYRCGIANGFPPYQYRDEYGNSLGLDYEVATLVFKKAGLDVAFIQDSWEHLLFNLVHKREVIDILFGAEVTAERLKLLDFTIPYYKRRTVLFTLKGSSISKIEDLFGLIVAGDLHSSFEKTLGAKKNNIRIMKTSSKEESFQKLKDKSIVAVIAPIEVGLFLSKKLNLGIKIIDENDEGSPVAIAVRRGDQKMLDTLNPVLEKLIKNGEINKILRKYNVK